MLAFSALMSYVSTLYMIAQITSDVYWTGDVVAPKVGVGGVLDYNAFAVSYVHHAVSGNLVYVFVDTTAYFLTALIALNSIAWIKLKSATLLEKKTLHKLTIFNAAFGAIILIVYVLSMRGIDSFFKILPFQLGGVLTYFFPFGYWQDHLLKGLPVASTGSPLIPDVVSWLLFILILTSTTTIIKQLDLQPH